MITRILLGVSLPLFLVQTEWVSHKGDGYTVSFPGKPTEHKQDVKSHTGAFITVSAAVFEVEKGAGQFVVSWSEYPEAILKSGTEEKRLDNARDGAVASMKGTLKKEVKIKIGEHQGRDLLIVGKERIVRTRIITVNKRMFQLTVVGSAKIVEGKDTEEFLKSFKLAK